MGATGGYKYEMSELSCPAKKVGNLHLSVRLSIIYGLPLIIIGVALLVIKRLQSCAVNPEIGIRKNIKMTVRLILLLSGTCVVALLPIVIARVAVVRYFSSRQDSESVVITLRILTLILCLLSPSLNPLIQFTLQRDMYVGAIRLFGSTSYFSWQREMQTTVNVVSK